MFLVNPLIELLNPLIELLKFIGVFNLYIPVIFNNTTSQDHVSGTRASDIYAIYCILFWQVNTPNEFSLFTLEG